MSKITLSLFVSCFITLTAWAQTQSRPTIVDRGSTSLDGEALLDNQGHLSNFIVNGIDFVRSTDEFESWPSTDYRVDLILEDGTLSSAPLHIVLNSGHSDLAIVGVLKHCPWSAVFPTNKNFQEVRIFYKNQQVFFKKFAPETFPCIPVLTQIERFKIRVEPIDADRLECSFDGGENLEIFERNDSYPDSVFTIDPSWCRPGIPPIFMVDVIKDMRRYTAWLLLDMNFQPPQGN